MNKFDIKKLINNDHPIVLDIGCYNGKDSKELSDVLNCFVHCFEPDPLSQLIFRGAHGDNQKLILYPYALGSVDGDIEFHQSDHPQSNSIKKPKEHLTLFPNVVFDEVIKVDCIRLDTWYMNMIPDKIIDFIWADVNGSEIDLIEGGRKALANTRYFYLEVSKKELYEGQQYYEKVIKLLPDFKAQCMYNWGDNFGNVLLKNKTL